MAITKEDLTAGLKTIIAFGQAIREAGPEGTPSGVLYADAMSKGISLEGYTSIINTLKKAGVVKESPACLLTWIGD